MVQAAQSEMNATRGFELDVGARINFVVLSSLSAPESAVNYCVSLAQDELDS